ncbi:DEHA2F10802p [Debaryomyces hansenii CBS767]|uniref:DEHA2F10802p n=1 Tax=Debaryomyces hansenii (strain ATCC 36239 / CBS 767 / BCRC 21394 / JCM 1990 / NBRC 0083 / IGC 2968) TaxID=284592 RepID=Q6BLT8_DEBHA|nr:DEHA2F10802p [Debaryomyces hansenii CBS767]CAG89178.1 DEHA2F10802p [Debaryomyces hansenii CBS767]|eukprot:XP_460833.1 DEHA2F10802p [Debaryomyces hansenii CBS767]
MVSSSVTFSDMYFTIRVHAQVAGVGFSGFGCEHTILRSYRIS